MINQMQLNITDFGPIKEAKIKLNKLNVIAGENGCGKSTSSKLLYCFLTASSKEGNYLANNSVYERFVNFILHWHSKLSSNQSDDVNLDGMLTLINKVNLNDNSFNESLNKRFKLLHDIIDKLEFPNKSEFLNDLEDIEKLAKFNQDQDHKYFNVSNVLLNSEFNFSELNDYKHSKVHLYGDSKGCKFSHEIDFEKDKIGAHISEGYVGCLNFEDVVYIDSPSIFELNNALTSFHRPSNIPYHVNKLGDLISLENNKIDVFDSEYYSKIEEFQKMFSKLINGSLYFDSMNHKFMFKQGDNEYSMKNTASGIKQLSILNLLLEKRVLKENSFLFIDEPEINLHPEWLIKLAEILVLLSRELNIYMYINSHSPQFIEAIEVYSGKYGLVDESTFYLSELSDNNYIFKEISRENLSVLYDNLGKPYDVLDEIRGENIANGIF